MFKGDWVVKGDEVVIGKASPLEALLEDFQGSWRASEVFGEEARPYTRLPWSRTGGQGQ